MTAESDVLVVGGGSAGCVVARRVADATDARVLLLEAGPDLGAEPPPPFRDGWNNPTPGEWPHDWGYQSEPDAAGETASLRRGRVLGGTSWLTRFAVRGPAADFDAWAAAGNPGWSYEDVVSSFRRLEADIEYGDHAWHGDQGPMTITRYPDIPRSDIHRAALEAFADLGFPPVDDHNAPSAIGVGPMPMSTADGRRITTLDAYLPALQRPSNLTILPRSEVASILIEAGRATGVRLLAGGEIRAGWVVLAAGTYGSPSVLMRSGIGPADHLRDVGIDVLNDLPGVGRNLADHPGVDLDSGWKGDGPANAPVLHSIATFRSSSQGAASAPDLMFWVTDPAGQGQSFYLDPILLKPSGRGFVRLRSKDPGDKPRITLPDLTDADVDRLADAYLRGLELASHGAVRRLASGARPPTPGSREELRNRVRSGAYSIPHVVGTCRMGPNPADGDVVDALGRVHGIEALSVIDASIIPEPPTGFPQIVTIMIAEHIAANLPAPSGP